MNMIKRNYIPCTVCGKKAIWSYMPSSDNYCDKCVPRGCSCRKDEEGNEKLDEQGRSYPCCEYSQIAEEFHIDPDMIDYGWEAYYKDHPEERRDAEEVEYWEDKLGVE